MVYRAHIYIIICTAFISGVSLLSMEIEKSVPKPLLFDCRNFDHLIRSQASVLRGLVCIEQEGYYCEGLHQAMATLQYNQDIVFDDAALCDRKCNEETIGFLRKITRRDKHCRMFMDYVCGQKIFPRDSVMLFMNNAYAANAQLLWCDYGGVTPPLHYTLRYFAYAHDIHKQQSVDFGIRHLLRFGANVDGIDHKNRTPLHVVRAIRHLTLLLAERPGLKRPDLNALNERGMTPLNYHIKKGRIDCARALLETGADTHITDNLGNTPLHYVMRLHDQEFINLLLAATADFCGFNVANKNGETPADIAFGMSHNSINQLMRVQMLTHLERQIRDKDFQAVKKFIEKYPWLNYEPLYTLMHECYPQEGSMPEHNSGFCNSVLKRDELVDDGDEQGPKKKRIRVEVRRRNGRKKRIYVK